MSATDESPATRYTVLQQQASENGHSFKALGEFAAVNDIKAVEQAAERHRLETGTFIAVPVRSFRPRTLETEKVTRRRVQ